MSDRIFRRPFMVESTVRLYSPMGQTDPVRETFADVSDAVLCHLDHIDEGHDVAMYWRAVDGEWVEFP